MSLSNVSLCLWSPQDYQYQPFYQPLFICNPLESIMYIKLQYATHFINIMFVLWGTIWRILREKNSPDVKILAATYFVAANTVCSLSQIYACLVIIPCVCVTLLGPGFLSTEMQKAFFCSLHSNQIHHF